MHIEGEYNGKRFEIEVASADIQRIGYGILHDTGIIDNIRDVLSSMMVSMANVEDTLSALAERVAPEAAAEA